jgi:cytochrome c peroxidase
MHTPLFATVALAIAFPLVFTACGDAPATNTSKSETPVAQRAADPAPANPIAPVAQQPAVKKPTLPPKMDGVQVQAYFSGEPAAPASDNKVTAEKVALGKLLFHEKSLSRNDNLSCASCHSLSNYGVDNKATSEGSDGQRGGRNTPTVINASRQFVQFWDGRAATIEDQAIGPVLNPIEHGLKDEAALVAKMKAKPLLVAAFALAFPGEAEPVSASNFQKAVGAFSRTLVTKSPFDEYLDGKQSALTTEQKWGLKTFIEIGCTECHTTRLVGGHMYQKLGTKQAYATKDEGRFLITKDEKDKFVFKVPSLLNVEKTAPYMHDGSVATLEEMVKIMARVQANKEIKDEEVASIVAFLKSLTGPVQAGLSMQ